MFSLLHGYVTGYDYDDDAPQSTRASSITTTAPLHHLLPCDDFNEPSCITLIPPLIVGVHVSQPLAPLHRSAVSILESKMRSPGGWGDEDGQRSADSPSRMTDDNKDLDDDDGMYGTEDTFVNSIPTRTTPGPLFAKESHHQQVVGMRKRKAKSS